jgi:hypothetical protein
MARDPLAAVSLTATPQTRPIPGRTDQVRNNAGGYVFGKDLFAKVEDFLILGTTGGTFYITEDRLTADNAGWLIQAVQADGARVLRLITEVSTARPPRAPKNRAAVFALAMVFACGDPAAVQAAKVAFPRVRLSRCATPSASPTRRRTRPSGHRHRHRAQGAVGVPAERPAGVRHGMGGAGPAPGDDRAAAQPGPAGLDDRGRALDRRAAGRRGPEHRRDGRGSADGGDRVHQVTAGGVARLAGAVVPP